MFKLQCKYVVHCITTNNWRTGLSYCETGEIVTLYQTMFLLWEIRLFIYQKSVRGGGQEMGRDHISSGPQSPPSPSPGATTVVGGWLLGFLAPDPSPMLVYQRLYAHCFNDPVTFQIKKKKKHWHYNRDDPRDTRTLHRRAQNVYELHKPAQKQANGNRKNGTYFSSHVSVVGFCNTTRLFTLRIPVLFRRHYYSSELRSTNRVRIEYTIISRCY